MDTDFNSKKEEIIRKIRSKVSILRCPVCSQGDFVLGDGYFAHDLQKDLKSRVMGGANIPTVPIVCKTCGYVMEFAAGALDLLPKPENNARIQS